MSTSPTRGSLSGRLAAHFTLCAGAAAAAAVGQANADVVYTPVNWSIPVNIDGLYIQVDTLTTAATGAGLPGWDLNPYGTSGTGISFFWPGVGPAAGVRLNTAAGGNGTTLSKLPLGFNVGPQLTGGASGASFGTGGATFATATNGYWSYNAVNHFGFRFTAGDGAIHYGWARMEVGATATTRTITGIAWENEAGVAIVVGDEGGPPPDYDPCAPFNPTVSIGANSVSLNQDTAEDLQISGCGGQIYSANYFKFTPPASGVYVFDTCASGVATRMAILGGCAAGSAQLACNDNSCGSSSSVSAELTAGVPVYVVVGAEDSAATLPSPISIAVDPPPSPYCATAANVSFGSNTIDNSVFAGDQVVRATATNGTSIIYKAAWFKFTPTVTGAYTIGICGAVNDTKMAIASDCPDVGGTFQSIAYNDDACVCSAGCGTTTQNAWASKMDATTTGIPLTQDLVAGTPYYILVGGYGATTATVSGDLVIDGPPPSNCPADIDGDGIVGGLDLSALLAAWGNSSNGDIDGDSDTDGTDLTSLLAAWGTNGC